MIDIKNGKNTVIYARNVIEEYVKNKKIPFCNFSGVFKDKKGAFVTIHTYPDYNLRGCIGIPLPVMSLCDAIAEGAKSATNDPRFPPLKEEELSDIVIEVTVLSTPKLIKIKNPTDYFKDIVIGRHGLIVEQGFYKGLLLPQVPVEQGWDKEEFLKHTCIKAGLMPDAWFDKQTKVYKFDGQVFTEIKPRGEIKEKKLNE
jgi:uncharacterized protein (TIGR00296 family)